MKFKLFFIVVTVVVRYSWLMPINENKQICSPFLSPPPYCDHPGLRILFQMAVSFPHFVGCIPIFLRLYSEEACSAFPIHSTMAAHGRRRGGRCGVCRATAAAATPAASRASRAAASRSTGGCRVGWPMIAWYHGRIKFAKRLETNI